MKRSDLPVHTTIEGLIDGKRRRGRARRWIVDICDWRDISWEDVNKNVNDPLAWRKICSCMLNTQ